MESPWPLSSPCVAPLYILRKDLMTELSCESAGETSKQSCPLSSLVLPENEDYFVVSRRASTPIAGDNQDHPQKPSKSGMGETQNLGSGRHSWHTVSQLDFHESDDDKVQVITKKPIISLRTGNQRDHQFTVNHFQDPKKHSSDVVAPLFLPENEDILVVSTRPTICITDGKLADPLEGCQEVVLEDRGVAKLSQKSSTAFVLPRDDGDPVVTTKPDISIPAAAPQSTRCDDQERAKHSRDSIYPLILPEKENIQVVPMRPITSVNGDETAYPPIASQSTLFDGLELSNHSWDNVSPLVLPENEDIQVVSKKPVISFHRKRPRQTQTRHDSTLNRLMKAKIVALLSIPLVLLLLLRKREQRRKRHYDDNQTQPIPTTSSAKQISPSSNQSTGTKFSREPQAAARVPTSEMMVDDNLSIDTSEKSHANYVTRQLAQLYIHESSEANDQQCTRQFETNLSLSTSATTPSVQKINDRIHRPPASSQMAGTIRLLQDMVQEKCFDSALAQQMTIALHSSQQLILAQEHVKLQAMFLETHQKLIIQQHEAKSCYDPNWRDKLRDRRDRCWNAACRLIWDVGVAHVLAKVAKPLLPLLIANRQEGYMSSTTTILQVLVNSICDCSSPPSPLDSTSRFTWLFYPTFSTEIFSSIWSWDSYIILEQGACYGHCFLSLGIVSTIALVAHQLLRAFSFPVIFHHAVNAFAISMLLGGLTPMDWISHIRPELLAMALSCVIGLLANVEWKYRSRYRALVNCTPGMFRNLWEQSIDTMDTLQFQVSITRFIALAILGSMLWLQFMDDKEHIEKSSTVASTAVTLTPFAT